MIEAHRTTGEFFLSGTCLGFTCSESLYYPDLSQSAFAKTDKKRLPDKNDSPVVISVVLSVENIGCFTETFLDFQAVRLGMPRHNSYRDVREQKRE